MRQVGHLQELIIFVSCKENVWWAVTILNFIHWKISLHEKPMNLLSFMMFMDGLRSSEISLTWFLCSLICGHHYVFSSSLLQSQTRLKSQSDFPGRINITTIITAAAATTTTTTTTTNTITIIFMVFMVRPCMLIVSNPLFVQLMHI